MAAAAWCAALGFATPSSTPYSVAFYYGRHPDPEILSLFDWAVVEPRNGAEPRAFAASGSTLFAYVSVGEIDRTQPWAASIDPRWTIAHNDAWKSTVVDLRSEGWRRFLIDRVLEPLYQRGYRGFFLDTLDSFQLAKLDEGANAAELSALAQIITEIHRRYPDAKLLLNRGFEVVPEVHAMISGVAAENLFDSWDAGSKAYRQVPQADQAWLIDQLKRVRDVYHLPAIVIDYRPPAEREEARRTAARISALGFIPWITNPSLDMIGVGAIEPIPRRLLLIHGTEGPPGFADVAYADVHRLVAPILEWLGYSAEYNDASDELFDEPMIGRYAGVVAWLADPLEKGAAQYRRWLLDRVDEGTRVVLLGTFGVETDGELLKRLGLESSERPMRGEVRIKETTPLVGFEAPPAPRKRGFFQFRSTKRDSTTLLRLEGDGGAEMDPIIVTSWGGIALSPYFLETGFDGQPRWILNPFEFFKLALRQPVVPVPDATTENGRRIFFTHIDGDGFASRAELPGNPFAGQVILDEILKKHPIPHTVSVIEGETGATGMYPKLSPELESIARKTFALPNVEIASHTYSHPFKWPEFEHGSETVRLAIPGYRNSLDRELRGSVEYIEKHLAPPDKKCKLLLWSGNSLPSTTSIALVDLLGIGNMNGSETAIAKEHPWVTYVSPLVRPLRGPDGIRLQVYAAVSNDRWYTDQWSGPYYGFRKVIETFELTEAPRRMKAIDIYYHYYSGTKPAALTALKQIFTWAEKQETIPLFASEYQAMVAGLWRATAARRQDGGVSILMSSDARTMRVDPALGFVDLDRSEGVAGFRDTPRGRYVALTGAGRAQIYFSDRSPRGPYLVESNARILSWRTEPRAAHFRLRGHVPVEMTLFSDDVSTCRIVPEDRAVGRKIDGKMLRLVFERSDTRDVSVVCR